MGSLQKGKEEYIISSQVGFSWMNAPHAFAGGIFIFSTGSLIYVNFAAIKKTNMSKGPVSEFIQYHYRHFNAAALVDAAKGYETHLLEGGKMMITLAGAMSTAELGVSLAEMIRQDKVGIISCTGAKLT